MASPARGVILAFLLASLALLLAVPYAQAASQGQASTGDFRLEDVFWASWPGLGAYNTLCVVLGYEGDGEASSIEAKLNVSSIWPAGGEISDSYDGPLRKGQSVAFYFTFLVPAEARASHYNLTLTVDYEKAGSPETWQATVQATLAGLPDLAVSCSSYELNASSHNRVELLVANEGSGVARAVRLQVSSLSPYLTVIGPSCFKRDLLYSGEEWAVVLDIYVATGAVGAAYLSVAFSCLDQFGTAYQGLIYLGFEVEGRASLAVSKVIYVPPTVFPGDKYVAATVFITNVGDYRAKNITLRLEPVEGLVEPSYAGSEEVTIPYLPVGYVVNTTFLLDVDEDAGPGYYELPLYVRHDGLNYTLKLPFTVQEKASFEVLKIEFSPEPSPGARGVRMKVELKNVANVEAKAVRLSVVSAYITGVTSVLIGDMMGGEIRVVVMEVDFDEDTPLDLDFEFQVSWFQGGRQLFTTLRMSLRLQAPREWPEPREVAIWLGFMGLGMAITYAVTRLRRGVF